MKAKSSYLFNSAQRDIRLKEYIIFLELYICCYWNQLKIFVCRYIITPHCNYQVLKITFYGFQSTIFHQCFNNQLIRSVIPRYKVDICALSSISIKEYLCSWNWKCLSNSFTLIDTVYHRVLKVFLHKYSKREQELS